MQPAKSNAPLTLTSPERMKITVQNLRVSNKELENQIQTLPNEIQKIVFLQVMISAKI